MSYGWGVEISVSAKAASLGEGESWKDLRLVPNMKQRFEGQPATRRAGNFSWLSL